MKPQDIEVMKIFFRDQMTYVIKIHKELQKEDEKDYSTHYRRVNKLWKQGFLQSIEKVRDKEGQPKYYSLTFKGLLALFCDKNINILDVMKRVRQVFEEENEEYLSIFSDDSFRQTFNQIWNKSIQHWIKIQAKSGVDLSTTKNLDIMRAFTQNMLLGTPEIFKTLTPEAILKIAEFYKKTNMPLIEKYQIGYCELTLKINLPIINFNNISSSFAENLQKNNWQQAKSILENAAKSKEQINYWLKCRNFERTQDGDRKCSIGEECVYRNFLLCPKVRESITNFLKD